MSQKFVSDNPNMYGHVDTCEIHASVASEMKTLHISKQPLSQKYTSKTFSLSFLALKKMNLNIYTVVMISLLYSVV